MPAGRQAGRHGPGLAVWPGVRGVRMMADSTTSTKAIMRMCTHSCSQGQVARSHVISNRREAAEAGTKVRRGCMAWLAVGAQAASGGPLGRKQDVMSAGQPGGMRAGRPQGMAGTAAGALMQHAQQAWQAQRARL